MWGRGSADYLACDVKLLVIVMAIVSNSNSNGSDSSV